MERPATRKRSRVRTALTVLIVGIWIALMGILVKDRYFPGGAELSDNLQIAAVQSDDWFVIRIRGAYAGFGRSRQYPKGDKWLVRDELSISLNIQGRLKPIRIIGESTVDKDFRLTSFVMKVSSGIISFEQKGRMEGRNLVLDIPGGGSRRQKLYRVPRISRSLGLPLPLTGLKVGDKFSIPIFDPLDGRKSDAFIRVLENAELEFSGRKVEAWLVRAVFRTMEVNMWIDREGRLLKGRLPLGITVVRSDRDEISSRMAGARDLPEMMSLAAVPVKGVIPDTTKLKLLRLKVAGGGNLHIPSDDFRQKADKSGLTITRESDPKATYSIPNDDPGMKEFLTPSRFIRSDHPVIMEKAREIVGREKDPVKAARLINEWVYKNLKKIPTPSVPDAATILKTLQGDCNEHAVLAVSLARAVGIPARIALGLVYMDGGFYYHAWAAYWAGEKWFTGDPLTNQLPADPTHVTLLYGDVDKHMNVITFLGRLRLEILEAS